MTYVNSMFKTLLLHIIYEQCLEVVFGNLRKSFSQVPSDFKVGQYFTMMEVAYQGSREITQLLWFCRIDSIDNSMVQISHANYDDPNRHIIYVTTVSIYDIAIPDANSMGIGILIFLTAH